jgi:hypothetical protein
MTLHAFTTSAQSAISGLTWRSKIAVKISPGTREVTVVDEGTMAADTVGNSGTDMVEEKDEIDVCRPSIIEAYIDDLCIANISL